jgi:thioredoxin reductase (NADPH)
MQRDDHQRGDCLIVGGGPAGLAAAIYLARFRLSVVLADAGESRAAMIPIARNLAGFPTGIKGSVLLDRMRRQAIRYGAVLLDAEVTALERDGEGVVAVMAAGRHAARAALLATGVRDHRPPMSDPAHDQAVAMGLLRYCPICDGYEVTDRSVAVIGASDHAIAEALFLRSYTRRLSLVRGAQDDPLPEAHRARLVEAGITLLEGVCLSLEPRGEQITLVTSTGQATFDTCYSALGTSPRSHLVASLGVERTAEGCVRVDEHQQTAVPGLFAAGDVVAGLNQVARAMGTASVAATAVRNMLNARSPLWR